MSIKNHTIGFVQKQAASYRDTLADLNPLCATEPERFVEISSAADGNAERVANFLHTDGDPLLAVHSARAEIASICGECEARDACLSVGLDAVRIAQQLDETIEPGSTMLMLGTFGATPAQGVWLAHNPDIAGEVADAAQNAAVSTDDLAEWHYAVGSTDIDEADLTATPYDIAAKHGVEADVFAKWCAERGLTYTPNAEVKHQARGNTKPESLEIRKRIFGYMLEEATTGEGWITQRELVDRVATFPPELFAGMRTHSTRKQKEGGKAYAESAWVSAYQWAVRSGLIEKGELRGKVAWRWIGEGS